MTVRMVATIKRFVGHSRDIKPIDVVGGDRVGDGSTFLEEDTANLYGYAGGIWSLKDEASITLRLEMKQLMEDLLEEAKKTNEQLALMVDAI